MSADAPEILAEALIVGAGPVGLYQAFQLGLQGIHAHVVDVLPAAGGQCAALYPGKLIHDIPALPPLTGAELTARLVEQLRPFAPTFHLAHEVAGLAPGPGDTVPGWRVTLQPLGPDSRPAGDVRSLDVRFVVIAAGAGAFQAKPLRVPGLEAWLGRQVFQHLPSWLDAAAPWPAERGRHLIVMGAEDEALDTVQSLLPLARAHPGLRLTLVHRREPQAAPDLLAAFQEACAAGLLHFEPGQPVGGVSEPTSPADPSPRLVGLQISDADDRLRTVPADLILARQGLSPRLGPLAHWGLALDRKQVPVDPARFATGLPGVYAVGDVVSYPGKRKLIACGFHEATLAGFAMAEALAGGPIPLEYTTSSRLLQRRLGVA